jgi:hypothetical protein
MNAFIGFTRSVVFAFAVLLAVSMTSAPSLAHQKHGSGLGAVLHDAFGGGIFGWDIDKNGNDGLLSESTLQQNGSWLNSIETFDETTGQIVKVVKKQITSGGGPFPFVDAIAGNDVGIIDEQQYDVINTQIVRDDFFYEMNPVTGNKITSRTEPPHYVNLVPSFFTDNQASSSQIMMGYWSEKNGLPPRLYPYDLLNGVWGQPYAFPKNQALSGYLLYASLYPKMDIALTGFTVGQFNENAPLWFDVFEASSGKFLKSFKAPGGKGWVNGMALDPTTGIMCTTSADMSVAFTNVSTDKGFLVQIPVLHGGGALTNGADVTVDPIHHLFLIAQLNSTFSPNGGSTVIVYDERGHIVEAINGFGFLNPYSPIVVRIAVNPNGRIGYAPGTGQGELQQFSY